MSRIARGRAALAGVTLLALVAAAPRALPSPPRFLAAAADSPYVYTPESQLPGAPPWQRAYQNDLDRAHLVGFGYDFFSLTWTSIQSPATGAIDVTPMDPVV